MIQTRPTDMTSSLDEPDEMDWCHHCTGHPVQDTAHQDYCRPLLSAWFWYNVPFVCIFVYHYILVFWHVLKMTRNTIFFKKTNFYVVECLNRFVEEKYRLLVTIKNVIIILCFWSFGEEEFFFFHLRGSSFFFFLNQRDMSSCEGQNTTMAFVGFWLFSIFMLFIV